MVLSLKHQTKAEFLARLKLHYEDSVDLASAQIADFLITKLNTRDITERQIKTITTASDLEWISRREELIALQTSYDTIKKRGNRK